MFGKQKPLQTRVADVRNVVDCYPFGSGMKARTWSAGASANGFNGKRKDDEVKGEGNQYDYGFRIYDPRIGKFLSVDPLFKSYAFLTPYQFSSNDPIKFIDLDGLEATEKKVEVGTEMSIQEKNARQIIAEKHRNVINQDPIDLKKPAAYKQTPKGHGSTSAVTGWQFDVKYPPGTRSGPITEPSEAGAPPEANLGRITTGEERGPLDPTEYKPIEGYEEGTFKVQFNQATTEDGTPISITYEIGVLNPDGTVADKKEVTSNSSGEVDINYKLKEGQTLYTKQKYEGIKKEGTGGSTSSVELPKEESKDEAKDEGSEGE